MRAWPIPVLTLGVLLALPAGQAVYFTATWDPAEIDFDEAVSHEVAVDLRMETNCVMETFKPPAARMVIASVRGDGPAVRYFLDGDEIFPGTPVFLPGWEPEPGVLHTWTAQSTIQMEIMRHENATIAFTANQAWLKMFTATSDPCALAERVVIHPVLYGFPENEPLLMRASAIPNETADNPALPQELPGAPMLATLVIAVAFAALQRSRTRP